MNCTDITVLVVVTGSLFSVYEAQRTVSASPFSLVTVTVYICTGRLNPMGGAQVMFTDVAVGETTEITGVKRPEHNNNYD